MIMSLSLSDIPAHDISHHKKCETFSFKVAHKHFYNDPDNC